MPAPGSMTSYVDTRRIGEAAVTVISDGAIDVPMAWTLDVPEEVWQAALPEIGPEGTYRFGQNVVHISVGDASILVDAGLAPPAEQVTMNPFLAGMERTPGVLAGLASIEVRPEEITHVLLTHNHWDHVAGLTVERDGHRSPRFPNARHLIGRADWVGDLEKDAQVRLSVVEQAGLLEPIDGEREVVRGVSMLPAPGESPGHMVVRLDSRGQAFYALGDLVHHPIEIERPAWMYPERDKPAMLAARARIYADAADEKAAAVFTHAPFPAWGRIAQAGGGYRWEWI